MDTTIRNLDEEAYRRIKARAALEGRTLGEAVSEAMRRYAGPPAVRSDRAVAGAHGTADEVAESDPREGYSGTIAAARKMGAQEEGAGPATPPPTLAGLLERLAGLGRPDPEFLDELEAIQAAQPPLGPGPWES